MPGRASIRGPRCAAAAQLIGDYFRPMAERIYGDVAATKRQRAAALLPRWIIRTHRAEQHVRHPQREVRLPGLRTAEARTPGGISPPLSYWSCPTTLSEDTTPSQVIALRLNDLPQDLVNRLPRYPLVPATLIGRLAVDRRYHGRGCVRRSHGRHSSSVSIRRSG